MNQNELLDRADSERDSGGVVEIDEMASTILVRMSSQEEWFFQDWQADELLESIPEWIEAEDYLLAVAQDW